MKNVIRVGNAGQPIKNLDVKDHSLHESYALPKIPPEDFDATSYTFGSNPGLGTVEMFTIPFERGYTPMAQIMVNEDGTDTWTPLTEYFLYYCGSQEFVSPFRFGERRITVTAEIDDDRIRVYLTKSQSGGYYTGCSFPNISGDKLNFKYYVFLEGLTDDDLITVDKTV